MSTAPNNLSCMYLLTLSISPIISLFNIFNSDATHEIHCCSHTTLPTPPHLTHLCSPTTLPTPSHLNHICLPTTPPTPHLTHLYSPTALPTPPYLTHLCSPTTLPTPSHTSAYPQKTVLLILNFTVHI
jgi:hypothetical protein